ncbi:10212_t:CDS:2, partial [Funneliformis geosporum]
VEDIGNREERSHRPSSQKLPSRFIHSTDERNPHSNYGHEELSIPRLFLYLVAVQLQIHNDSTNSS